MAPFRIDSARLHIRAWQPADRPAFAAMAQDAALMRYISNGVPHSEQAVDTQLARQAGHMARVGYCMGAAVWRDSGEVIGVIGMQPVDRDPDIDLGWWVARAWQGRGLAQEGARAVRDWLRTQQPGARASASIHPENLASQAVARGLGLVPTGPLPASQIASWRPDTPVLVFRETAA